MSFLVGDMFLVMPSFLSRNRHLMTSTGRTAFLLAVLASTASQASTPPTHAPAEREQCVRTLAISAADDVTLAEIRRRCEEQADTQQPADAPRPQDSPYERREQLEKVTQFNPFVLSPFKPNYFLPLTYHDSPNQQSTEGNGLGQRAEFKFQLSVRFPVWMDVLGTGGDLHVAYTGIAWWQAYDGSRSRPFRETNHEPEVFLSFDVNWPVLGTHLRQVTIGINHQSNGRKLPTSRSWNRIVASIVWEYENRVMIFRPWYRIPDPPKESADDPRGDENPNIERFVGQFELIAAWRKGDNTYAATWRNNARADNRGSLAFSWSFPLAGRARGYVQAFTGYGEALIDYDDHHNRIGLGILLTDWL